MGAVVNNGNLGCVALTYSLLSILEKIGTDENMEIEYILFEINIDLDKVKRMSEELNIPISKIKVVQYGYMGNLKSVCGHALTNIMMIRNIKSCDLVIDVTAGDSFTDIYGKNRFYSWTRIKRLVEALKIPLVLAPQTYGPFQNDRLRDFAVKIINNASFVIARDQLSADYIHQYSKKEICVTTDMAFSLPCRKNILESSGLKIGINVSDLLMKNKTEGTEINFALKTDYDQYIDEILFELTSHHAYEIHLIPHVTCDVNPCRYFHEKYPATILHEPFKTPIEAKECIATMDVFIGARMHATIGAFSAGAAVIPTAYSRKFSGIFYHYGYDHIVDLQVLSTQEARLLTLEYVQKYESLKQEVQNCRPQIDRDIDLMVCTFKDALRTCKSQRMI